MGQRAQAAWRFLAFLYAITIASLVTGVVAFIGFLWMIVDVIWQLISGKNTLSEKSMPARVVQGTLEWNVKMLSFALTGGEPMRLEWTPMSRI